jgi:amino acid transporter
VHLRFRTPYKATILTCILVAFAGAIFPLAPRRPVNIGTLMAFVMSALP